MRRRTAVLLLSLFAFAAAVGCEKRVREPGPPPPERPVEPATRPVEG